MAFYKRISSKFIRTVHQDPMDVICLKRSTMDRFIVTVDRFDRTVTPKMSIKRGDPSMFKLFELEIKKLICLDTSPLVSLDFD